MDDANAASRYYRLGPFCFASEIELLELPEGFDGEARAVNITRGPVEADRPGMKRLDPFCAVAPDAYLLDIPGVARYLVTTGREVWVDAYPGAAAEDVRGYLLGSVFGALCHQNDLFPLHASAVRGASGVTAFLGDSGAGKSTTAAFLAQRGFPVVSDDICLLEPEAEGLRVIPVAGWLKLWRESMERLGEQPDHATRVFSAADKYRRYLPPADANGLRLTNVVFVERLEEGSREPLLTPMGSANAVAGLMDMTYLSYIPELNGTRGVSFARAAQVLQGARAWRLGIPWGWDALQQVLDLVERELLRD